MKRCTSCGIEKPFSEFSKSTKGCKNGLRSKCKSCRSAQNASWNQNNKERVSAKMKEWRQENHDHIIQYRKKWQSEKFEERSERFAEWAKNNRPKLTAKQNARRAQKISATPNWLSSIDLALIQEFYDVSACISMQTGIKHNVDHIIPLNGEGVCGLHVPWNLRIITATENFSKKNKLLEFPV